MKWTTTIPELASNPVLGITPGEFKPSISSKGPPIFELNKADENISKSFVVYNTEADLRLALKTEYEPWFQQEIPSQYLSKMNEQASREHYALFVGGWVQYHDTVILKNMVEHTVYFDWSKPGLVRAYLKTEDFSKKFNYSFPPTKATDPPKPPAPPPPYA
jgi:hypothetical protein